MNWKPHTEHPDRAPITCLLADCDDEVSNLLSGIYTWDGAKFRHEDTDKPPRLAKFWWISESDVLEGLPK